MVVDPITDSRLAAAVAKAIRFKKAAEIFKRMQDSKTRFTLRPGDRGSRDTGDFEVAGVNLVLKRGQPARYEITFDFSRLDDVNAELAKPETETDYRLTDDEIVVHEFSHAEDVLGDNNPYRPNAKEPLNAQELRAWRLQGLYRAFRRLPPIPDWITKPFAGGGG